MTRRAPSPTQRAGTSSAGPGPRPVSPTGHELFLVGREHVPRAERRPIAEALRPRRFKTASFPRGRPSEPLDDGFEGHFQAGQTLLRVDTASGRRRVVRPELAATSTRSNFSSRHREMSLIATSPDNSARASRSRVDRRSVPGQLKCPSKPSSRAPKGVRGGMTNGLEPGAGAGGLGDRGVFPSWNVLTPNQEEARVLSGKPAEGRGPRPRMPPAR